MIDAPNMRDACQRCYLSDRCDGSCRMEPYPMRGLLVLMVVAASWAVIAAIGLLAARSFGCL